MLSNTRAHTQSHTHTEKEKETLSNDLQGETWEFDTCREDDREAEHTPTEAENEKLGRKRRKHQQRQRGIREPVSDVLLFSPSPCSH